MSTNLDAFADFITEDFSDFEGGNGSYIVPGEVITLTANDWTTTREVVSIGDKTHEFNTRYRFVNPILSSITLRHTDTATRSNRPDFNAVIVANRELHVEVEGEWISLEDLCIRTLRNAQPNLKRSNDDILLDLRAYGFDPRGRLPMYLQHLGANEDLFPEVAAHFMSLGAKENTNTVMQRSSGSKSHVQKSYRHDEGVPVVMMEISRADRTQSATNSGFIGFLDSAWNTFIQAISYDRKRSAIRKTLASDPGNSAAVRQDAEIREQFSNPTRLRAFRNWGGTSTVRGDDIFNDEAVKHYAQQVPCGRFSVQVTDPAGRRSTELYSVWGTRAKTEVTQVAGITDEMVAPETGSEATY